MILASPECWRIAEHLARTLRHQLVEIEGLLSLVDLPSDSVCLWHVGPTDEYERSLWSTALQVRGAILWPPPYEHRRMQLRGVPMFRHGIRDEDVQRAYEEYRAPALAYQRAFPGIPGIGSLAPDLILIGEQPNPRTLDRTRGIPFAYGGAGQWLFAALGDERLRRRRIYITNAIKSTCDDVTMPREIRYFQALGHTPQVVALGLTASAQLTKARISHVTIDHPQHARRFHHHEPYHEQLLEALNQEEE